MPHFSKKLTDVSCCASYGIVAVTLLCVSPLTLCTLQLVFELHKVLHVMLALTHQC